MSALTKFLPGLSDANWIPCENTDSANGIRFAPRPPMNRQPERGGTHGRKRKAQTGGSAACRYQHGHCRKLAEYVS